ncbi:MAG: hypothetical protein MUF24_02070 [Chitinophagaceae bacterium]|nr:hypothetical protein [Chitinophagaceae bacterium]
MKNKGYRIFFFVGFLILSFAFFITNQIQLVTMKGVIDTGTEFTGKIIRIVKSNNHSFGIIVVEIEKITQLENGPSNYIIGKPFRIVEMEAEVYGTIGIYDTSANQIVVNSSKKKFYLYRNGKLISEGNLVWINEVQNLDFIEKYSSFYKGK